MFAPPKKEIPQKHIFFCFLPFLLKEQVFYCNIIFMLRHANTHSHTSKLLNLSGSRKRKHFDLVTSVNKTGGFRMAQTKDKLQVVCDTGDAYTLVGRSCELSAFSYVPTTHQVPKERTYFNTDKKVCKSRTHVRSAGT